MTMEHATMLDRRLKFFLPFAIILLVILSYANTLYSPFTLDDFHSFINSPQVYTKDISLHSLASLSNTVFGKSRLIPIITFAIDHHLSNGSIVQYHITNILIHLLNTCILFWFLTLLLKTRIATKSLTYYNQFFFCFATTSLWALNPVQTNAVTYLVQRMASLSTLFYLVSLSFYLSARTRKNNTSYLLYFLSAVSALLAFMSKQNSATLPIAIIIIELIFISTENIQKIFSRLKWQHWLAMIFLILLISPIIDVEIKSLLQGYSNRSFTLGERLLTETRVVLFYISLLLLPLPSRMNMEHDFNISFNLLSPPSTLLALLILSSLFILSIRTVKNYPLISFGLIWYFLNIALESTILPLELAFEHRNYLPSVGLFIALVSASDHLAKILQDNTKILELRKILGLLLIILICISSVLTTLRNNDWRDSLSLAADNVAKSPHKARALSAYGTALAYNKRYEESIQYFEKAIAESQHGNENYLDSTGNILASLSELGKPEEAIKRGEKFLKEMPEGINLAFYTKYLANLGTLHITAGNFDLAYEYTIMALRLEPAADNNSLIYRMSYVLNMIYDNSRYREFYKLEKTGDQTADVMLKMAQIAMDVRDYGKAFDLITSVEKTKPGNQYSKKLLSRYQHEINLNKAAQLDSTLEAAQLYKHDFRYRLYIISSRFILNHYPPLDRLAGRFLQEALKRYPDDPFVVLYLSRWYAEKGRQTEALDMIEKTLLNHPNFIPLLERAGRFYLTNSLKEKQLKTYRKILSLYPGVGAWNQYESALNRSGQKPVELQEFSEIKGQNHV